MLHSALELMLTAAAIIIGVTLGGLASFALVLAAIMLFMRPTPRS